MKKLNKNFWSLRDSQIRTATEMREMNKRRTEVAAVIQESKEREARSMKLPKFFRKYYMRFNAYQLRPFLFIIFFFVKAITSYGYLAYLKLRRFIGVPKDVINTNDIGFIKSSPLVTALYLLNPGGQVFQPSGTEEISAEITIPVGNLRVHGSGAASILKMADSANIANMFITTGKSNITFDSIQFDANGSNQASGTNRCIFFSVSSTNHTVRNCVFTGSARTGSLGAIGTHTASNISIRNNFCFDFNEVFLVCTNTTDFNISGNFLDNFDNGSAIDISTDCERGVISNNVINDAAAGGIVLVDAPAAGTAPRYITIVGNVLNTVYGPCIDITQGSLISVANNIIIGNHTGGGTSGISVGSGQSSIVGNVISGKGTSGIELNWTI
jgi:hypothetical protein